MKTLLLTDRDTSKKVMVMFGAGAAVIAVYISAGLTKIFSVNGDDMATVIETPETINEMIGAA